MKNSLQNSNDLDLLQLVVRFLNFNDVRFEKIKKMINDSTTEQIAPVFAYLGSWVSNQVTQIERSQFQAIIDLFDLFLTKVPPVVLVAEVIKQNLPFNTPNYNLLDIFQPVFQRFQKVLSLVHPLILHNSLVSNSPIYSDISQKFFYFNNSYFQFESETDPCFHDIYIDNFQRLIIGHASIDRFQPLLQLQNSKFILTQAIVRLLKSYNSCRKASHSQLIFMFTSLFLYIQTFAEKDQIDGHIFCEYLKSNPYLSPFCILAFVNYISKDLYLFHHIVPYIIDKTQDKDSLKQIFQQYFLIDLSYDDSLNDLISKIPKLALSSYRPDLSIIQSEKPITDSEKIFYIHNCGTTVSQRLPKVIQLAQEGELNSLHVAAMDLPLLKAMVVNIFGRIKELVTDGILTTNLFNFLTLAVSLIMPTYGEQFCQLFFSIPINDYLTAEIVIRSMIFNSFKSLLYSSSYDFIIPYIFECLKPNGLIQSYARLLLQRYLIIMPSNKIKEIHKCVLECNHLPTLLDVLSFIDLVRCDVYDEYAQSLILKEAILKRLPFEYPKEKSNGFFLYDSIKLSNDNSTFDPISQISLQNAKQFYFAADPVDTLTILIYSSQVKLNSTFAQAITKAICEQLNNFTEPSPIKSPFPITVAHMVYPLAIAHLYRLFSFNYLDLALITIKALKPFAIEDHTMPNWLNPLLAICYNNLTQEIKNEIISIIREHPNASKFFLSNQDLAYKATNLLIDNDMEIVQDHDLIKMPYKSMQDYITAYIIPSFILSTRNKEELIENLLVPIFDTKHVWKQRDKQCYFMAVIASRMPNSICISFIENLLLQSKCSLALDTFRYFMIYSDLNFFRAVCRDSAKIINNNDKKIEAFMSTIIPSFSRLVKDKETATELLCGILQSVTATTPKRIQESVIDVIVLLYINLKLDKSRGKLINASSAFPPELRRIIASSLNIEINDNDND